MSAERRPRRNEASESLPALTHQGTFNNVVSVSIVIKSWRCAITKIDETLYVVQHYGVCVCHSLVTFGRSRVAETQVAQIAAYALESRPAQSKPYPPGIGQGSGSTEQRVTVAATTGLEVDA
jgi:hypothetical protein